MFFAGITCGIPPVINGAVPEATGTVLDPLSGHPKYRKVQELGTGTFGFVQLAVDLKTNESVAVKFIARDRINRYVEAEILNHRMLRHFHVIKFKEVLLTRFHVAIVMEYANFGNLSGYLQRVGVLNETAARFFFQQLICALDYCHRRGVVNRDVKLQNTLLELVDGLPMPLLKICDFGYSKGDWMSLPKSKVGTLAYMAPEVIIMEGSYDGKQADLWSCGVVLYFMLFGQFPFEPTRVTANNVPDVSDRRMVHMVNRILSTQWSIPEGFEISEECHAMLKGLLTADVQKRLTMDQLKACPWFSANLPPNALEDNDRFLNNVNEPGLQSVEDIKNILLQAKVAPVVPISSQNTGDSGVRDSQTSSSDASGMDHSMANPAVAAAVAAAEAAAIAAAIASFSGTAQAAAQGMRE